MLKPAYTIQFQKRFKKNKKRGEKIKKLKSIIIQVVNQKPLDERDIEIINLLALIKLPKSAFG